MAQACRERDIKTVAVSAGYICAEPRLEFFRHMDAANIDLKGFTEGFYKNLCSGRLQPVLETLEYLKHSTDVWFEITTLLIPGENDSAAEISALCHWVIERLGPDVPLHFSAFHPDWKLLDKPPTPPANPAHGAPYRQGGRASLRLHRQHSRSRGSDFLLSRLQGTVDRARLV